MARKNLKLREETPAEEAKESPAKEASENKAEEKMNKKRGKRGK